MWRYLTFLIVVLWCGVAGAERGTIKVNILPVPPRLASSVLFSEPSGNKILDAEETGKLVIGVTNQGKGDAYDVKAEVAADREVAGFSFDREVPIGTVPAGSSVKKEVELRSTDELPTGKIGLRVTLKEGNGFEPAPVKISFNSKGFQEPSLVVADLGIESQGGKTRIEPMAIVSVTARVQNVGHGEARDVVAEVQVGENVFVAGDAATRFELGVLPSGQFKDVKFQFYTNNRIANGAPIPIGINISEARPRFGASIPLKLTMNAGQRQIHEVVVQGRDKDRQGPIELAKGLSVDVDQEIPLGAKAGRYDIAVVIGNRDYEGSGSPNVEYAVRDAQVMREYLVRTLGYDPENILYVENAPLSKFNELFGTERDPTGGKLYKYVRKGESRVFIYYAGHGAPDLESNEAYFVPVDANAHYLKANGYRLQTFYDNISRIPAKKMTVILDSCFSGNSEKGLLFKNVSPALVKVKKELRGPANALIITSAGNDQVSTWYPEKRHSLFTYYFLKGLQGDADPQGTGRITVNAMRKYLMDNVPYMARRLTGNEQLPVVTGTDDDVIAVIKK